MEKLLTVVIPAYNAEKYITYTLDSLCAGCKDQDLKKKNQSWTGNETEIYFRRKKEIFLSVFNGRNRDEGS